MKINFQVDGGIGKSVLATAVCNARKRQPHTIAALRGAIMEKRAGLERIGLARDLIQKHFAYLFLFPKFEFQ